LLRAMSVHAHAPSDVEGLPIDGAMDATALRT
jgi:hypothetical protein